MCIFFTDGRHIVNLFVRLNLFPEFTFASGIKAGRSAQITNSPCFFNGVNIVLFGEKSAMGRIEYRIRCAV